jgi:hypothetical protein
VNDAKPLPPRELLDADCVLPGEGAISLAAWLRAIAGTGFDGFIALELLGPRLADLSPEECAAGEGDGGAVFAEAGIPWPFKG